MHLRQSSGVQDGGGGRQAYPRYSRPSHDTAISARVRTASRMAALDKIVVLMEKKVLDYWVESEERKGGGVRRRGSSGNVIVGARQKVQE